jgi:hypothetical protein
MPRGWLLFLCAVLLVWWPLSFAVEAATVIETVWDRGVAATVELAAHAVVAALSFAAGWALWQASPAGRFLASCALAAGAAASVQALYWSALPTYVFPSDRLPLAIFSLLHAAAWLVYLRRSKQVTSRS